MVRKGEVEVLFTEMTVREPLAKTWSGKESQGSGGVKGVIVSGKICQGLKKGLQGTGM